ncbi:hypothetical protein VUR80DRAFT_5869 [Thermomyces stellatus]
MAHGRIERGCCRGRSLMAQPAINLGMQRTQSITSGMTLQSMRGEAIGTPYGLLTEKDGQSSAAAWNPTSPPCFLPPGPRPYPMPFRSGPTMTCEAEAPGPTRGRFAVAIGRSGKSESPPGWTPGLCGSARRHSKKSSRPIVPNETTQQFRRDT